MTPLHGAPSAARCRATFGAAEAGVRCGAGRTRSRSARDDPVDVNTTTGPNDTSSQTTLGRSSPHPCPFGFTEAQGVPRQDVRLRYRHHVLSVGLAA